MTSYLEQGYLTLFAKAKEVTLFCLGSLIDDSSYRLFAPALGEMFKEMDEYLGSLGNPLGVAAYRPGNARGENNLHNYLGMCGIPLEPYITYPEQEKVIFLSEGAASDEKILDKMKQSLLAGSDVIVTSGFIRKLGEQFGEFVNVAYTSGKALVSEYADTKDNGLSVSGRYSGDEKILIPQLSYCTNDIWELAAAYGTDNNFPVVLRCSYGKGKLSILTIPDNMGDIYHYPEKVLNVIRDLFTKNLPVQLEAPAGVQLFAYDNQKIILRSDLPYYESVTLRLPKNTTKVRDIVKGSELSVEGGRLTLQLAPGVNYVLDLQ
jgi:hypothetical protein